ncbi:MAG: tetratricopeptide repeat protein [Microcystis sp. M113S1]|uniref:tetratricopeptide repeat protein n=1 Tax=Microcystis sp. M113S1 TaxID=2771104 RepID=UPI00258E0225|nr:tetratricopeptide repeat protein [Microcystis sp. M113S1]MCA2939128.1 tetratricopeptide repeat protein [Microcystis sp. M113S1]
MEVSPVVHQVNQTNQSELEPGTIAHTAARLLLWGRRPSRGLARVEFYDEFSRQQVVRELENKLQEQGIIFHKIVLPRWEKPSFVLNFLLTQLAELESGVVSITGFETAFSSDVSLVDALQLINFNRENLARFNLRQIWWMTHDFTNKVIRFMPDLNSWFFLRLSLTENSTQATNYNQLFTDKNTVNDPYNLPKTAVNFVGREQELSRINQAFQQSSPVVLSGMGGSGKTELALQYAWQHKGDYPAGICWINVLNSDPGLAILFFAREYLGLNIPNQGTLSERVRYCWQNWPEGNALIIFDDVRDYDQIKSYLPPVKESRFRVLITTRKEYLSATIATFRVEVLKEEDALDLLRSYLENNRIDTQIEEAKLLCQDLGYLPLGLELVARLLKRRQDWKISKIRQKLAEKGLDDPSLDRNPKFHAEMTGERGLKAAFNLSWEKLNSEPDAQILALYLSLFALAPFPKGMILDLFPDEDGDTVEEWLTDSLVHLSLVQDMGDVWYEIHPLLRRYFRDKLEASPHAEPAKSRYCTVMTDTSRTVPQTPSLDIIQNLTPLIPHIEQAVREYPEYIADEDLLWSYTGLARYYNGQGLYAIAEPYCQACLTATRTRLGDNHPDVATSLNNLALLYYSQGRYPEAEPLYLEALDLRKQLLGDNHPGVATSLNNLAGLYYSQGRYPEAEPLLLEALDLRKQLLGDNHPDVATSLNNLALLYYSQGRYPEAEPLLLEALDLSKRLLGDNHPDVATSLNNLALLYCSQGRYPEAEPLYLEALDLSKRLLGDNHPDVAASLNNLAYLYQSQGRYPEAEPLLLEALDLSKRLLGDNHPDVAASLNNLAYLYQSQGRYPEAEPLYLEAIKIATQVLGENHPHTQTFYQNYLRMLSQLPEAELRQRFPEEVVEMLKPKPPHP